MRFRTLSFELFVVMASLFGYAEDPCGYKAQSSALGQAGHQLLTALALSPGQHTHILAVLRGLEDTSEKKGLHAELSRQKLFDETLVAVEDGSVDDDERRRLDQLYNDQRAARQALIESYKQAQQAILEALSSEQAKLLTRFAPEIELSAETLAAAHKVLRAFRQLRQSYLQGSATLVSDLEDFNSTINEARFVVYIPPWIDLQLEAISTDVDTYRDQLLTALAHARPINEAELDETDRMLDGAITFLQQAVALANRGRAVEAGARELGFNPLELNQALLVSPVFSCLLANL